METVAFQVYLLPWMNWFWKILILLIGYTFYQNLWHRKLTTLSHYTLKTASILRQKEWVSNTEYYLTSSVILKEEVLKFKTNGFFQSDLGNTTVLAAANILETTIIVVTSIENMPYIRIDPRKISLQCPIYIAFNQEGSGHYDDISFNTHSSIISNVIKCRCGINDKELMIRCTNQTGKYNSRCPCYNSELLCTSKCACHNCHKYGQQPNLHSSCSKRKWESYPRMIMKSPKFIESKRQAVRKGIWSKF